jgi:predicted Zn-dependent peptidase
MDYKKQVLKNSLRVITVPMPSLESATVTVWIRTGSRNEESKVAGISHFSEHIVFKGSKKRPHPSDIFTAADSLGAEMNAGTEKEWTNFYIKGRVGILEEAFDVLSDMVLRPILDKGEIEKEKEVIIQEMNMYQDIPMRKVIDYFENVVYKGSSLAGDIIGTKKTIKTIGREDFVNYRKKNYYSENMLLTVAGGVSVDEVEVLAEKCFSKVVKKGKKPVKPNQKLIQNKPEVFFKKQPTDQAHLVMGFKGNPIGSKSRFAEALLMTILAGGPSSRVVQEIREKRGLAYAVASTPDHRLDNGYVAIYSGLKTQKTKEAIEVMLDQCYGLANLQYKIGNEELHKAKEYVKGHLALSLEDTSSANEFFGLKELMLGEIETPDQVYREIDKVKIEEIYALAQELFKPQRLNLAIIGPFDDKKRFEKLLY